MNDMPAAFVRHAVDVVSTEVRMLDGVFVKSMVMPVAGMFIPQHAHTYAHLSALVKGSIHVWRDGKYDRVYHAPAGIVIAAGVKHTFQSVTDETTVLCIHDIGVAETVEIQDEHHLVGDV